MYWSDWFNRGGKEPKAPGTKIAGVDLTQDSLVCGKNTSAPTPTPSVTPTPKPSVSPTPLASPIPTPTPTPNQTTATKFLRGDVNGDGSIDITDMFNISQYINEGAQLGCADGADVNDDGVVDISDFVYWSDWFNRGGKEPKAPGTKIAGVDLTQDSLVCGKNTSAPTPTPSVTPTPTPSVSPTPAPSTSPTPTVTPTPIPTAIIKPDFTVSGITYRKSSFNSFNPLENSVVILLNNNSSEKYIGPIEYQIKDKLSGKSAFISTANFTESWPFMPGDPYWMDNQYFSFFSLHGEYQFEATIDPLNKIQESDESNNSFTQGIVVPGATNKFLRGDVNGDGRIDITDMFNLSQYINEGAQLGCADGADVNDDGSVDISDFVYWSNWYNRGGAEPKAPGTKIANIDPTSDSLSCK